MEEVFKEFLTGALPGIIIAFLTAGIPTWAVLRKLKATAPMDNATKLSGAALKMVESYRKDVADLRKELHVVKKEFESKNDEQDREIAAARKRVTRLSRVVRDLYDGSLMLVKQIKAHGLEPVWVPPVSADELLTDIVNGD